MYRSWSIAVVGYSVVVVFFVLASIGGLSNSLHHYYEINTADLSFLNTVNNTMMLVASLVVGPLTAIYGPRSLLKLGGLSMVIGSVLFFVMAFKVLLVSRVFIGFGAGIIYTSAVAYLNQLLSRSHFAYVLAAISAVGSVCSGLAVGPVASFIDKYGFSVFLQIHLCLVSALWLGSFAIEKLRRTSKSSPGFMKSIYRLTKYARDKNIISAAYVAAVAGLVRGVLAAVYVFPYLNLINNSAVKTSLENAEAAFIVMAGNAIGQFVWPILSVNLLRTCSIMRIASVGMGTCLLIFTFINHFWIEFFLLLIIGIFSGGIGSVYAVYIKKLVDVRKYPSCLALMFLVAGVLLSSIQFLLSFVFYLLPEVEAYKVVFVVITVFFFSAYCATFAMKQEH